MKKLRLLITEDCNRSCVGCCNKDWDLTKLDICRSFKGYDIIMLTGGEPMLYPYFLIYLIKRIRSDNPLAKIYMYTAKVDCVKIQDVLNELDGITVTLHKQKDVEVFNRFSMLIDKNNNKSLRLNIFKEIDYYSLFLDNWIIKDNMEWINNCPLPKDEVFMRI